MATEKKSHALRNCPNRGGLREVEDERKRTEEEGRFTEERD